ncbi:uncharacterized protein LOC132165839 [Corylus avellana]|uniref:uncharacterized protein LOC132165839 n=1 Tax=Corylus avellana TaxID=13451 RepID=UPI00286D5C00|nr:uncharacterized protein LOC132165839 [Corylus avellana]
MAATATACCSALTGKCPSSCGSASSGNLGGSLNTGSACLKKCYDYIMHLPNEVMSNPMGAVILPMIQNLETTLKAGAVPQVPQFRPPAAQPPQTVTTTNPNNKAKSEEQPTKAEEPKTMEKAVPPAVKPTGDPLGNAWSKVQEEIGKEFAAIMATGTLRPSKAAALATRRVMQRYGNTSAAMPQS